MNKSEIKPGDRFNKLTVVNYSHTDKNGKKFYKCICDCGTEKIILGSYLKYSKTKSCGCIARKALPNNHAEITNIINLYKISAKRRNIDWQLTRPEVETLIKCDCHYCGAEPSNLKKVNTSDGLLYNGIDRVDSSKGYTADNVVTCCSKCNYAKHDMTLEQFKDWLNRICEHLNKQKIPT